MLINLYAWVKDNLNRQAKNMKEPCSDFKMDLVQFAIGLMMILIGMVIIFSPELATVIAVILAILGAVAIYDAVYGTKK